MQYYTDKDEKDVETSIKSGYTSLMLWNHVQKMKHQLFMTRNFEI